MKQRNQMARLCLGAVIAALYTVLTLALPVLSFALSNSGWQRG